jgi:hypothetical protein
MHMLLIVIFRQPIYIFQMIPSKNWNQAKRIFKTTKKHFFSGTIYGWNRLSQPIGISCSIKWFKTVVSSGKHNLTNFIKAHILSFILLFFCGFFNTPRTDNVLQLWIPPLILIMIAIWISILSPCFSFSCIYVSFFQIIVF